MIKKFCVYAHFRPDNVIFYIGKGTKSRSNSSHNRNNYWKNIVKKYGGFRSEILAYWETEKESFEHEKILISCFKDLGYSLANMTNGGEGSTGFKWSKESKEKLSKSKKGIKQSDNHCLNNSLSRIGSKHSKQTIEKMRELRKNGTVNSRPINVCGIHFQSITNFAKYVKKAPIWIKKCVDANKYDKLEMYIKNAK